MKIGGEIFFGLFFAVLWFLMYKWAVAAIGLNIFYSGTQKRIVWRKCAALSVTLPSPKVLLLFFTYRHFFFVTECLLI